MIKQLKDTFEFGQWQENEDMIYCGKNVTLKHGEIFISQKMFSDNITVPSIPKSRSADPSQKLMPAEITERLSARGSLNWLVGQTRPDLAASAALCKGSNQDVQSLMDILTVLKEAVKTKTAGNWVRSMDLWTSLILIFSDASWANAEDLSSIGGYLIFLASPDVMKPEGGRINLVEWRSAKVKRKCKSTLTAETIAMEAALDAGLHVRTILAEALYRDYVPSQSGQLHADLHRPVAVTDCKSLYDCLVKDGPQNSLSEKRLAVDIVGLQDVAATFDEENPKETFRWIPGHKQLADAMAKRIPPYKLREILERGWVSLVAEDGNDYVMRSENNTVGQ